MESHHRSKLRHLYAQHPVLEILNEASFPFLFFVTLAFFYDDSPHKFFACALCALAYFVTNKIPMSLCVPETNTATSLAGNPLFASVVMSAETLGVFLLLLLGFTLVFPPGELSSALSEFNRGSLEGVVTLAGSVFALTLTSFE